MNDLDGDYLPDDMEAQFGYNPEEKLTEGVEDTYHYGEKYNDCEDYTLRHQVQWTVGSADKEDWANPGKQY